jgi:stage IV sporulation protein FB
LEDTLVKVNKFFFPYILFFIFLGFKGQIIMAFLIVFFHELTHYFTALILGFTGFDMEILPIGARLSLKDLDEASPKQDIVISLSAPLMNLALALILYFFNIKYESEILSTLFTGNLAVGLFNIIPAFPLDGGRVLRSLLQYKTIYRRANELTIKISVIEGVALIIVYFVLLLFNINNLNLGIVAVFILYSSHKERERIVYIIMGDIVKKRYKFLKNGYIENKSISIHYKNDLLMALSILDKNKYNIFTVLDDELKVMDIMYEEELIEGVKNYGNMTLEEYINIRDVNI